MASMTLHVLWQSLRMTIHSLTFLMLMPLLSNTFYTMQVGHQIHQGGWLRSKRAEWSWPVWNKHGTHVSVRYKKNEYFFPAAGMATSVLASDLYTVTSCYISGLFVCLYFSLHVIYVSFLNSQDDKIEAWCEWRKGGIVPYPVTCSLQHK